MLKSVHFIPKLRNFTEVSRLPEEVKNAWLKSTLKYIKNLINNNTFMMDGTRKIDQVAPFLDV